jgi:zinc protease
MKTLNFTFFACLLIVTLADGTTWADGNRKGKDVVPAYKPKSEEPPKPVVLPPIHQKTFANGLKVIVVEHHELPIVSLRLMCKAGSFFDPTGKAGLTQFTTSLMDKGTETLSATDIAQKIDFMGGSLNASSGWDASYVETTVLKKYLSSVAELFRDVALHPAFSTEEIERLRQQTLSSLETDKDQPESLADKEFNRWLFSGYPYAQPIEGTETSVASFSRDDVLAQYGLIFIPNNAVLAVVGDVDAETGFDLAQKVLGDWKQGVVPSVSVSMPAPPQGLNIHLVDKPDATQAQIRMGHLGVSRQTEDYFPLVVMNYILGGGGFSSRLMKEIRSKMGLTYGISSGFAMRMHPGEFVIETFTKNASVTDAIKASRELVKQFQVEGPTEEELKAAKAYLTGSYPMNFETPSQIAGQLLNIEIYNLGSDYIAKYRSRIEAVTIAEVRRVAEKYLHPDNLDIVVVSKAQDVESSLKGLAPVTVIGIE